MAKYFLGIDLGSSSVKVSLLDAETGNDQGSAMSPDMEMRISSPKHGWAEQNPEDWWTNLRQAINILKTKTLFKPEEIKAIGIAYQMHGLVLVDKHQQLLRKAIIWCDSRAVEIGEEARVKLGDIYCFERLLNSPGNFTASKLKWVKNNEPDVYDKIYKIMLPGDYLAMKLSGEITTTVSGLSEGTMWDFQKATLPERLFDFYGIEKSFIPDILPTFSRQGELTQSAADELGLVKGTPIGYRAGDQPNNAFSLNCLHQGDFAATAGTSGVIYGVTDQALSDSKSRVNTFAHVNHGHSDGRYGVLLCVNGTGIINSWLRNLVTAFDHRKVDYEKLNSVANKAPIGADGLMVLPFGNGAERMLNNRDVGASFHKLDLNRHNLPHISRSIQEGVVCAMGYGFEIIKSLGLESKVIKAGNANMFLSELFCEAFVNVIGVKLELYNTNGSLGAARGAGFGIGYYNSESNAFSSLKCIRSYHPDKSKTEAYAEVFQNWKKLLDNQLTLINN